MTDTKKLHAGIAYLALVILNENEKYISEEQLLKLTELSEVCEKLGICTDPSDPKEVVQECISLIEEYIKEQ